MTDVIDPPTRQRVTGPNGGQLYDGSEGAVEVYGPILDRYLAFGGRWSPLGLPVSTVLDAGPGSAQHGGAGPGRYVRFTGGAIYWTAVTGARVVRGDILDRWLSLGAQRSFLGYPTTDELPFDEGGRVSIFQGGEIYWWPDTGAVELSGVVVRYEGMSATAGAAVNAYGLIAAVGAEARTVRRTRRRDIRPGVSLPETLELYRGRPTGLAVNATVVAHRRGDPDSYLRATTQAVRAAGVEVAPLVAFVPYVGPVLGAAVGRGVTAAVAGLAEWPGGLVGDDVLGSAAVTLSPKRMVELASAGASFTVETTGNDGTAYRAEFGVSRPTGGSASRRP